MFRPPFDLFYAIISHIGYGIGMVFNNINLKRAPENLANGWLPFPAMLEFRQRPGRVSILCAMTSICLIFYLHYNLIEPIRA